MRFAPLAAGVIAMHERRGGAIPPPYNDPPEVSAGLRIFLTAWRELNDEREFGASPTEVLRINRGQMRQWFADHGYEDDSEFRYEFRRHMKALDDVFIPFERARRKKEQRRVNKTPKLRPTA